MKNLVKSEMITAMKAKNKERLSIIRLINGKLTEVEKLNPEATEAMYVTALDSMVKERGKSIEAYMSGNNSVAANAERYEITVIEEFLPKRISIEELETEAKVFIESTNASSMKDMGKVIGLMKNKFGNSAKPADIALVVKKLLA